MVPTSLDLLVLLLYFNEKNVYLAYRAPDNLGIIFNISEQKHIVTPHEKWF